MTISYETAPKYKTITYYSPRSGERAKYLMPADEYEEFTKRYEENANFWKKHGITSPTELIVATLVQQGM